MELKQHLLGLSNDQIQDRRVCRYILRSQTANRTRGAAANPQSGSRSTFVRRRSGCIKEEEEFFLFFTF